MSKKSSANFKFKPTNFVNLFKITGLVMLSLFTFYFIYNYLTTGSFDLRPSASGALEGDGGVASCGALLTQLDCNKYSERGCSWVVGPKTTRTEVGPVTTLKPVSKTTQMNCEEDDCAKGNYGCKYTNTTKTVNQTQNQTIYGCDDGSSVSQSKCTQTGGSWIKMGTKTVTVPVTTTIKNCGGTYTRTYTVQEQVTDYVTKVVEIPGVGSCTGTLKPLPGVVTTPNDGEVGKPCKKGTYKCSSDGKSTLNCYDGVWNKEVQCAVGTVCIQDGDFATCKATCSDLGATKCSGDEAGVFGTFKYDVCLTGKDGRRFWQEGGTCNVQGTRCFQEGNKAVCKPVSGANSGKDFPGNAIPAKTNGTETYFNSDVESLCKKQYPEYSYHRNGWVLRTGKSWWSYIFTIIDNNNDPSHPLPTCEAGHVVVGNVYSSKDNKHSKRWGICCQTPETLLKVNQSKCGNFVFTKKSDGKDYSIPLSCQLGKNIKCLDSYVINDLPKVVGDIVFRDPNITKNAKSCTTSSNEIGGFCCP